MQVIPTTLRCFAEPASRPAAPWWCALPPRPPLPPDGGRGGAAGWRERHYGSETQECPAAGLSLRGRAAPEAISCFGESGRTAGCSRARGRCCATRPLPHALSTTKRMSLTVLQPFPFSRPPVGEGKRLAPSSSGVEGPGMGAASCLPPRARRTQRMRVISNPFALLCAALRLCSLCALVSRVRWEGRGDDAHPRADV